MVRKQRRRITFRSGKLKLAMTTKEKLAAKPKPDSYFRQDISIKVRRALARRHSSLPSGVSPVSFSREVSLSPLYKKEAGEKYINQVFTSVFKIGQGCFGDVYQARSKEDSNLYAIKVTNDTHTFIDKGEVIRLEKIPPHENCVRFFVAWQESYRLYIQMELCKTSLDKYLSVYHGIDERRSWEIFVDIALGLEHLHRNELIHLDLKPANIMISVNGVCKIGDFGLVLDLRELDVSINKTPVFVTVSEGDGRYVALEVLREKVYSKAADIFSLGLLMLETVSDVVLPNSGPDWVQIREGAIPFCYDECNLSTGFRQLIERMLLKNYLLRPSIIEVLQTPHAVEILNLRQIGQRCNIMATWDEDHIAYTVSHPDIPTLQVGGPSPPRRPYPINYIPPLENARAPLKELNLADGSKTAVRTEERYVRTRNVARRLF